MTDAELLEKRGNILIEALSCLRVIAKSWPDTPSGQLAAMGIRTCAAMTGVTHGAESGHARLTDAGWAYRTNADHGWIIYCDPATGRWHPENEALAILEASNAIAVV